MQAMCLLGIAFRQSADFPVLILANREEFFARPSTGPRIIPAETGVPAWFGGTDLLAGGTWLGVNEHGLVVAVTNRAKVNVPANPPSRGLLCRRLLKCRETATAVEAATGELRNVGYAGCNLLIADRGSAAIIESEDELKTTLLGPGLYLIANGALDDAADRRIARVRRKLLNVDPAQTEGWFREARRLCALPSQGDEPAICLRGADRGTVSSSVLGLARHLAGSRFWHSPGPPDRTAYQDCTHEFRQLFGATARTSPDIEPPDNSPARRAARENAAHATLRTTDAPAGSPYRIHLRGPWQCEPVARAEAGPDGAVHWTTADLPAARTIRLPASWQELFGEFRGRVRFRRKFHPPSNIAESTRLFIVLEQVAGTGTARLNTQPLGTIEAGRSSLRFEATGLLSLNNELEIELAFTDPAVSAGGLAGPVVLEIQEA